jgi:hypothetical protein
MNNLIEIVTSKHWSIFHYFPHGPVNTDLPLPSPLPARPPLNISFLWLIPLSLSIMDCHSPLHFTSFLRILQ